MTLIHNTTLIPERLIREIIKAVKPEDTPDVNQLSLRNKQENITHGNWGQFIPDSYEITLCVPRLVKSLSGYRTYSHIHYFFEDELEFLATVIAHEYYHAWQWIHEKHLWHAKGYLEVCCEIYETKAIKLWNKHKATLDPKTLTLRESKLSYAAYRKVQN